MTTLSAPLHLKDWSFPKIERPASNTSADDFSDEDKIRIQSDLTEEDTIGESAASFQDRYLSSEEDLSPLDSDFDFDDSISIGESEPEILEAEVVEPIAVGKAHLAMIVSIKSAGKPKLIDIPPRQAIKHLPIRTSSRQHSADVPLLQTPTSKRPSLLSLGESATSGSAPRVPARSTRRPSPTHQVSKIPGAFPDEDDQSTHSEEPMSPASVLTNKATTRLRSLSRSISKRVVEPVRRTSVSSDPLPPPTQVRDVSSGLKSKLVARGANERAPVMELPPFPSDGTQRRQPLLRRRKSLMSLVAA